MKIPKKTCTDWQTVIRKFKADAPTGYEEKSDTIAEKEFCINMPDVPTIPPGPQGRPIDANLAINFISALYAEVHDAYGPEDIDSLEHADIKERYQNARKFLNKLVTLNYGMTIDRDFALKILSQPGCEGIRGYLCLKKDDAEAPLSLVTIGVDGSGYDLRYNVKNAVKWASTESPKDELPAPGVTSVAMQSLGGEYVTPPYTLDLHSTEAKEIPEENAAFYKRFVLLNIATGQKGLLDF